MYPTLEPFSAGFNKIDLNVVPSENDRPTIQRTVFEDIQYWAGSEELVGTETPMLFRYPRHGGYFEVDGNASVPSGQIELPKQLIQSFDVERLPSIETFLVTKPKHAKQLEQMYL